MGNADEDRNSEDVVWKLDCGGTMRGEVLGLGMDVGFGRCAFPTIQERWSWQESVYDCSLHKTFAIFG